jgi:two-component sensor histidine kinase
MVRADPGRLGQALTGLLGWAIERTPAGGRVRWSISAGEDGQARLTILDQGRPPQAGDPSLALTLARRLVEVQGGRLTLGPNPDAPGGAAAVALPQED